MAAHPNPSAGAQQFELVPDSLVRGVSDRSGSGRKGWWCVCPFPRASLEDGSKWTSIVSQFISSPHPTPTKEKPCAPPRPDWAAVSPGESR